MSERSRVAVMIFGEQYVLKTAERTERIKQLAEIVDQRMQAISERHPQIGVSKIAVLCAMSLADELFPDDAPKAKKTKQK